MCEREDNLAAMRRYNERLERDLERDRQAFETPADQELAIFNALAVAAVLTIVTFAGVMLLS